MDIIYFGLTDTFHTLPDMTLEVKCSHFKKIRYQVVVANNRKQPLLIDRAKFFS